MLPGTDGLALCRWIRSRGDLPVIMLTARGEEADRIVGLELGADDYVTKPFSPRELATRVRTVLRRATRRRPTREQRSPSASLELDARRARCARPATQLRLTAKEFDLLFFLAVEPARVFSRDQLMASVWGYEAALDTGTVTVHIRRLRDEDRGRPGAPPAPRDRLGRRLPVHAVIALALARRGRARSPSGSRSPLALRAPADRAPAARRVSRCSPSCLPLARRARSQAG